MRIEHYKKQSYIIGKHSEHEKILRAIELAGFEIGADETDADEVCYTVVSKYSTQAERQEDWIQAKKKLKKGV